MVKARIDSITDESSLTDLIPYLMKKSTELNNLNEKILNSTDAANTVEEIVHSETLIYDLETNINFLRRSLDEKEKINHFNATGKNTR